MVLRQTLVFDRGAQLLQLRAAHLEPIASRRLGRSAAGTWGKWSVGTASPAFLFHRLLERFLKTGNSLKFSVAWLSMARSTSGAFIDYTMGLHSAQILMHILWSPSGLLQVLVEPVDSQARCFVLLRLLVLVVEVAAEKHLSAFCHLRGLYPWVNARANSKAMNSVLEHVSAARHVLELLHEHLADGLNLVRRHHLRELKLSPAQIVGFVRRETYRVSRADVDPQWSADGLDLFRDLDEGGVLLVRRTC